MGRKGCRRLRGAVRFGAPNLENMVSHSFGFQVKPQRSPWLPGIRRTAGTGQDAVGTPCPRWKTSERAAEAPAGDRRRLGPGPAARSEDTPPRASPSSLFVPGVAVRTARSPCSPLPRHIAGAGPGRGSGLRTCWPPSPPTSILPSRAARTRARPSPAGPRPGPAGARVAGLCAPGGAAAARGARSAQCGSLPAIGEAWGFAF